MLWGIRRYKILFLQLLLLLENVFTDSSIHVIQDLMLFCYIRDSLNISSFPLFVSFISWQKLLTIFQKLEVNYESAVAFSELLWP